MNEVQQESSLKQHAKKFQTAPTPLLKRLSMARASSTMTLYDVTPVVMFMLCNRFDDFNVHEPLNRDELNELQNRLEDDLITQLRSQDINPYGTIALLV